MKETHCNWVSWRYYHKRKAHLVRILQFVPQSLFWRSLTEPLLWSSARRWCFFFAFLNPLISLNSGYKLRFWQPKLGLYRRHSSMSWRTCCVAWCSMWISHVIF
jgi:hypothetical protein